MKHRIYNWMMENLPYKLMYMEYPIDNKSTIWIPRWGWSKKQVREAEKLSLIHI